MLVDVGSVVTVEGLVVGAVVLVESVVVGRVVVGTMVVDVLGQVCGLGSGMLELSGAGKE